jgi:L-malate glycosyltransferase
LKITFILNGYYLKPGGGTRAVYVFANKLAARGHEVSVIHPRYLKNSCVKESRMISRIKFAIKKLYSPKKRAWQAIDPRVKMLHVDEPTSHNIPDADAVFATAWETAEYVNEYPGSKGRKFYLIQHYETWSGEKELVDATWRLPLIKIVIAKWLYEKGLELGAEKNEIVYIPYGVDHEIFRMTKEIEARPRRISMMYHTADWKGSADGIEAIRIAKEAFPDITAVFFSIFDKPADLPGWIDFHKNPKPEDLIENIYNGSSIFISPSWTEGSPFPPREAMTCGCALVSTDCTGMDEYAIDGVNSLLSPIKDPKAMANNIIRLLRDDGLRIKLAKAGNEKMKEFKWEKAAERLEKAINE